MTETPDNSAITRLANEPFYWIREQVTQVRDNEETFYKLIDRIKGCWDQCQEARVHIAFVINWDEIVESEGCINVIDTRELQLKQNENNSKLLYEIDIYGNVINDIQMGEEIETRLLTIYSKEKKVIVFWLGPTFEIYCNGVEWDTRDKLSILRDIKSRRRDRYLSINNIRDNLDTHYKEYVRDQARLIYWHTKDKLLLPTPEKIFQKSIWSFFDREVEGTAEMESMFQDSSRCDVKITTDSMDIYFIEVKWIGYSAKHHERKPTLEIKEPTLFDEGRAIDGAYQTKLYIEKNNSPYYHDKIKLGILVVYDAFEDPKIPISYGEEIDAFLLLDIKEYPLVTKSPSAETKGIARRKGLN